ncbi:DUF4166 domain-containing protein [Microbacterium suaedae]|uniref:DUF4166 domain-containing protein n=1 Tax=Microbacterium suaedae TaxID=2067813 RepID=UPI0013A67EC3|nr:DUF4166 domain-containing protein [Microbacterium suaedae]
MTSVFLTALGDAAGRLRPEVARYAAAEGDVIGEGIFEVAGSRFGRLGLLLRPFVGPRLVLTSSGRGVPFRVENRRREGPVGGEVHATRIFDFVGGRQVFADVLRPGSAPGTLVNLLGDAHRVELRLRCTVTGEGHLRLASDGCWVRMGRLRVRLPGVLAVHVEVEDGYDDTTGRQTVRARAGNPLLGTVTEYRGSFEWRVEPGI